MFEKSYVVYTIKTSPCAWEVKRRFSDFEWLRGILQKAYPHVYVIKIIIQSINCMYIDPTHPTEEAAREILTKIYLKAKKIAREFLAVIIKLKSIKRFNNCN